MADVVVQQPIRSVYKDGSIVVSNVKSKVDNSTTSYSVVNAWYDGTPMDDSKVDQWGVYTKYKATGEYLRENKPNWGELFLEVDTVSDLRDLSPYFQFLLWVKYYKGVRLGGYRTKGDTFAPIDYIMAVTSATDDGGSVIDVGLFKLVHVFIGKIDSSYFGVSPNIPDNSSFLNNAINYAKLHKPIRLDFPKGILNYSGIQNLAINASGITYRGYAPNLTTFKYNGGGPDSVALNLNGFEGATVDTPFAQNITVQDLNLLISDTTEVGLDLGGMRSCIFKNVRVNGGNKTSTIAIRNGAQLSEFYNLRCSYIDGVAPFIGMRTVATVRNGLSYNNSNNSYFNIQIEGTGHGVQLTRTDQNNFYGGTIEACTIRGLSISGIGGGRYNTFSGMGLESKDADWDILDGGDTNKFTGSYAIRVNLQSRFTTIENGFFDLIQINSSAEDNKLENVVYSHWKKEGYANGLLDSGKRTIKINTAESLGIDPVTQKTKLKRDKNYGSFDGSIISDSFRTRVINTDLGDYRTNLVKADAYGGFVPFQNSVALDSIITIAGSGIAVQRRGETDPAIDVGAWRLWTSSIDDQDFKLIKLNSLGVWRANTIITSGSNATTTLAGIVKQSTAVTDADSTANKTSVADASDLATAIALMNDLKAKYNQAVDVISELKSKLNSKMAADRNSGQQSLI